jgi:hypothetical protein
MTRFQMSNSSDERESCHRDAMHTCPNSYILCVRKGRGDERQGLSFANFTADLRSRVMRE